MNGKSIITGVMFAALTGTAFAPASFALAPLDPATIPQFVTPLVVPPTMPMKGTIDQRGHKPDIDYYEIAVRQFQQQILPTPLPQTTVWGYGAIQDPASFHYPAATIEADVNKPVRVKWINDLKDPLTGNFLPHLLTVDQTLHWANPAKECLEGSSRSDCAGRSQAPYAGPVPIVTHLHGAHVQPDSDGFPEAWYLPAANNIPDGYAKKGSNFDQIPGVPVQNGAAVYQYPNDQRATTLWYHDHSLGMTRVNVYAGPAGFYLLRGGSSDLPTGTLPKGKYEIPLAIQDRTFNDDGSLFYPDNRAFFEGVDKSQLQIPFIPEQANGGMSDVSPIWNPEFFGNTMVVNGNTWPFHKVEPRKYRLRLLNGSDSRFLILTFSKPLSIWQIGADGGFLPKPVKLTQLLLGPAERADVIIDFSTYKAGDTIDLLNIGPDEPFGGGVPGVDFPVADPATTGKVMQFQVIALASKDSSTNPAKLRLPSRTPLGPASNTRQVSLNEMMSMTVPVTFEADGSIVYNPTSPDAVPFGPTMAMLGTVDSAGMGMPMMFNDPVTENPALGATEIWEINNFTVDAHPIHLHLVQFEVVNRQDANGVIRPPEAGEKGTKDTVIAYPGEITRVKAKFDLPGTFIWHCHILSHEDNEMMRPYVVGPMP